MPEEPRISSLIYENGSKVNGPIVNQERILSTFHKMGYTVQVLCLYHESSPVTQRLSQTGIQTHSFLSGTDTRTTILWILDKVKRFSPDLFITDWIAPGWFASRWIKAAGIPCIGSLQSDDAYFWSLMKQFVGKHNAPWNISAVWCLSENLKYKLTNNFSTNGTTTVFIPSGVPSQNVSFNKCHDIKMAYIGRIEIRQKQILKTVKAMCDALKRIDNASVGIFGNGPDEDAVKDLVAAEGCSTKVSFEGAIPPNQIQKHLEPYNILVLLSDYEGTPGALLDGMAMGLVPVCLHCPGGIEEVVIDGKTGILVPDRGEGFVSAIERLANDIDLLQNLSKGALAHISSVYTIERTIERWIRLFEQLLKSSEPKKQLEIPRHIRLPKIDPNMAGFDFRAPTKWDRFLGQCKVWLGAIKRLALPKT